MHVALTGGLGTGKTTTARKLCDLVEDTHYVYMSRYSVRIPMALRKTSHPQILNYSRQEYINTILSNPEIPEFHFGRAEVDAFGMIVFARHGPAVAGEIALAVVPTGKTGVFDGVATAENVSYMKSKGVYIVGLHCSFETQTQRRLEQKRDIDPTERTPMIKQIHDTQRFYETEKCMQLAHIKYDTDKLNETEIACAIAPVILAVRK